MNRYIEIKRDREIKSDTEGYREIETDKER